MEIGDKLDAAQHAVRVHTRTILHSPWSALGLLLIIPVIPGGLGVGAIVQPSALSYTSGVNIQAAYNAAVYLHKPTRIFISTRSMFSTQTEFTIRIGQNLMKNFTIAAIEPAPISTRMEMGEEVVQFATDGNSEVTFTLLPHVLGTTAMTFQYGLDTPISFPVSTYP